jgi:PAS domain S-box-containing protein
MAPALTTAVLGVLLLATIYFTLFDWQWIAFLAGVLFAALAALASRASHAEWRIARRNIQITRFKELLAQETAARRRAEDASRASDEKMRLFSDALPSMLVYVDAGRRFRFHNRAYREWLGLSDAQLDGQLIGDVLDAGTYAEMQENIAKVLSGERVSYERTQTMASGAVYRLHVTYLPHFNELGKVVGYFGLLSDITERAHLPTRRTPPAIEVAAVPNHAGRPLVVTDTSGQTLYLNSMNEQLTGWSDPEARLRRALEQDEFRLYCQQIIALANGGQQPPYYEILIRLQEEEDNLTPPGAFIPVAEQFNMTTELDYWVVRNVIDWHRRHRRDTAVWQSSMYCINLFASTISDAGFSEFVRKHLADGDVPPQVLCFEVNESEAIARLPVAARFIADLRRIGCRTALGGFGGGKVSFDTLKHLPVHYLQIDGNLVRDLENNPVNLAKIKAISRVGKVLGVRTIAQFVENDDVLKKLADFGIDYAQGFGIAKPCPIEASG